MVRRRGARTGRGWDAAPARPSSRISRSGRPDSDGPPDDEHPVSPDETGWPQGSRPARPADLDSLRALLDRVVADPGPLRRALSDAPPTADPSDTDRAAVGPAAADPDADRVGRGRGRRRGGFGGTAQGGAEAGRAKPDAPPRDERELAREICIRQLAVRPRTRAELAKALARREISDDVIAEVLDRYDEVGMIDDAAFARAWVASRHRGRGLARRALADELRRHGVDSDTATDALATLDDDEEVATARALVDRKLRTMSSAAPDAVFRRLAGMLARKGYPAGVAFRVVKDALAARDAEAAQFADQVDVDALAQPEDPDLGS